MSTYRFEALLRPRSIAFAGAGARAGSLGRAVLENLRAAAGRSGP
jgi:acetyltransferase